MQKLLSNFSTETRQVFFDYYYNTFTRYPPYVIGLILGYYLHLVTSGEKKFEINLVGRKFIVQISCILNLFQSFQLFIWFFTVSLGLFSIYCGGFILNTYNQVLHAAYLAVNRIIWSLSIAVIIFLCCVGYGGPINKFLSCSTFHLLSKLNYSTYLVHYAVLNYLTMYDRTPYSFNNFHLVSSYFILIPNYLFL